MKVRHFGVHYILYSFDCRVKNERYDMKLIKRTLLASFALSVLSVGLPLARSQPAEAKPQSPSQRTEYAETRRDAEETVRLLKDGEVTELSVHDYLVGVVAAEMPASFELEALKAQAVAARTYLRRYTEQGSRHENADICADADCCQAYMSEDELKTAWGDGYGKYAEKIEKAVTKTDGQYLSYEGEAVLAAFHSSSAGRTESSAAVWSDVPYLVSVSSPEDADTVPNYVSSLSVCDIDFRDTVLYLHPEADFTGASDDWIGKVSYTDGGRVDSIVIGGVSIRGTELRSLFSLRSTAFEISKTEDGFTFTVTGYGHGVGMSQYGANTMAKDGKTYREILAHYYPDTTLIIPK